jgi:hypothetical protein
MMTFFGISGDLLWRDRRDVDGVRGARVGSYLFPRAPTSVEAFDLWPNLGS